MTCSEIKRELKCKFPPCPCQKCVQVRGENSNNGNLQNRCCRDIPPEYPIPKYQFQCKCAAKLEPIGPKYQRKCPPKRQRRQLTSSEMGNKECVEGDDCNTGKGCCNTGRNFLTFMINLIGYMAFVIIAALVFWLIVCHWVVVLGFKVYHSKRTTQVTVLSVIGLVFLFILCTAGLKAIRRGSTQRAITKFSAVRAPPHVPKQVTKKEHTLLAKLSSIFSFKWGKSKESEPIKAKSCLWLACLNWGQSTSKKVEPYKMETCSTWGKYFGCRVTAIKGAKQIPTKASSSWIPSFKWSQSSTKEIEKKSETSTYWISWRTSIPQPLSTKTEARYSWLPSFKWSQESPKERDKKNETRTYWMTWRTSTPVQASSKAEPHSSWLPSFKLGQKKTVPAPTYVEVQSSWSSYFTWRKTTPPSTPTKHNSHSSWTSYLQWRKRIPQTVESQSQKPAKRSSWLNTFKWGQTNEINMSAEKSDSRFFFWLPSFNGGRSATPHLQISHGKTECSSWMPSFNWGKSATETKKCAVCKAGGKIKSACAMKRHKVTVSIDDEEAQQIFKQSKLYAIPTEMKHPPKLVIYLRDHLIQSSD